MRRKRLIRHGGELRRLQPGLELGQELEVAATLQGVHQLLEGQTTLAPQLLEQRLELAHLPFTQQWQQLLIEALAQHIEIARQTKPTAKTGNTLRISRLRQQQGWGELLKGAAQPAEAHPHLVQRFRIAVSEHLGLQRHQPGQPLGDQHSGVLPTTERISDWHRWFNHSVRSG